jgi:hypothetical protein
MLAVAAQLPAAVLADEASGAAAIARIAQRANVAAFVLTVMPPSRLDERGERRHGNARPTITRPLIPGDLKVALLPLIRARHG